MLYEILAETRLRPKDAIMIGDTTFDLEMAQKAGMPRIGIAHGVHETKALRAFRPETIVDDLFALADDVILHRMRLTYEALADGRTGAQLLREMLHELGSA